MAVSTNIGLCEFRTAEQGIRKHDKNSANFRIKVPKKFVEKGWGEWIWAIYYRYQR